MKGINKFIILMFVIVLSSLSVFGLDKIDNTDLKIISKYDENLIIEKENIKIEYQEKINYIDEDINKGIEINTNKYKNFFNIKIDSSKYPNLNKSAKIIIKDHNFKVLPKIYKIKKENETITKININNKTKEKITTLENVLIENKKFIGYPVLDEKTNEYYFYVSGFSEYTLTDLISYYDFDESSGTTLNDIQNGYDGTNSGVLIDQPGKINKSYYFDGVNDKITLSNNPLNNIGTNDFTLGGWVKVDSIIDSNQNQIITLGEDDSGADDVISLRIVNQIICFDLADTTGNNLNINYEGTFNADEWIHIIISRKNSYSYIYLNGVKVNESDSQVLVDLDDINFNTKSDFGKRTGSLNWFHSGYIDEFGIWDRGLTITEIQSLYQDGDGLAYPFIESEYINCTGLKYNVTEYKPIMNINTSCVSDKNFTNYTLDSIFYDLSFLSTNDTILNGTINNPLNNTNYTFNICNGYICENFNISINWTIDDIKPTCDPLPNNTNIIKNENFSINVNCTDKYTNLTLDFYLTPETENKTIIINSSSYNENILLLAPSFDFTLYLNASDSRGNYNLYTKMYNVNDPIEEINESFKSDLDNTPVAILFIGFIFFFLILFVLGVMFEIPILLIFSGIAFLFMGVLIIELLSILGVIIILFGVVILGYALIMIKNN
jgi:hypothetical protein